MVPAHPSAAMMEALGRQLFFDRNLSASRRQSCASCHDPSLAFNAPNALAAQLGGVSLQRQGLRAVPTLRYLQKLPVFTEHYFDEDVDESVDNGPVGGMTWDGRVGRGRDQALIPLFDAREMANASVQSLAQRLRQARYAADFRKTFGDDVFASPKKTVDAATRAIEVFEQSPSEFYPYSSKFDAFLRHQASLSEDEMRGLVAFNDPGRGNCARCHPSTIGGGGNFPAFTDFGYIATAAPRNRSLAVNRNPGYFDLGLCGPLRKDLQQREEYCGMFRTPTLRNVALKKVYFHNGVFNSLDEVVRFYALRDLRPELYYARDAQGRVSKYDDLPERYWRNVDHDIPFQPLPNGQPRLSEQDIRDIVAFLKTLTDGYVSPRH